MSESQKPAEHLKVVSGNPSPEELAVVVAVVQAASSAAAAANANQEAARVAHWHKNAGVLRGQVIPGHGQWVASVRRGLH